MVAMRLSLLAHILLASVFAAPAVARDLGTGPLPIRIDSAEQLAFEADDELRIEGTVTAAQPVGIVLRIDDAQSSSYATRFNGERTLPPGPFRWTVPAKGLRTSGGRMLDFAQVRQLILFLGAVEGTVTVTRFVTVRAPKLRRHCAQLLATLHFLFSA